MNNQFLLVLLFTVGGFVLPAAAQLGNATYEPRVLETPQGEVCPAAEQLEMTRNEIRNELLVTIRERVLPLAPTSAPTYECGGTSGWTRVTFINMTNTSQQCPSGLALTTYSKRTCGRTSSLGGRCNTTSFSVGGMAYSRVCGRIIGYQFGVSYAFYRYTTGQFTTIESQYVDGVSLTHGAPGARQHIWTFAAGLTEIDQSSSTTKTTYLCPCSTTGTVRVPPFVGNDYFCESGLNTTWTRGQYILYPDDPLWDGQNCRAGTTCCQFNTPPWFTTDLPTSTSDDIELRLCYRQSSTFEDIPLELIELYVQ